MTESVSPQIEPGSMAPAASATKPRRRDYRVLAISAVLAAIAVLGALVALLIGGDTMPQGVSPVAKSKEGPFSGLKESTADREPMAEVEPPLPDTGSQDKEGDDAKSVMKAALAQIKAKQYDPAIVTLHQNRQLLQKYPEAYVMLGRALEGKKDYVTARDFYLAAIGRNPYLSEAYWGYATTSENLGDLESAIGGMRNYLHLEPNLDPQRLKVAQARSALWEWEAQLGRGPWGPTKGVPPGFTREELKRDGRGVATKMPIPGSAKPDGSMKYEIKHADKSKLFKSD